MKKFLCLMFALMSVVCIPVFAQDIIGSDPPDVVDVGFGTFAAFVAIIPFVVELFKKIPGVSGVIVQIVSWLTGVVLALIGWHFNLGFLADGTWYMAVLYGIGGGLAANGIFDTGIITWVLSLFRRE